MIAPVAIACNFELFSGLCRLNHQIRIMSASNNRLSAGGLIIALGIIFGDIGTSPLYVLNAITNGKVDQRPIDHRQSFLYYLDVDLTNYHKICNPYFKGRQ